MTEEELNVKSLINDKNKNKLNIRCQFCNSLMLKSGNGNFMELSSCDLPLMHQKNTVPQQIETENLKDFWSIDDMFTFENIGFSNTIEQTKYLICADCDMGPVGYHDLHSKKSYLSLKRVKHV